MHRFTNILFVYSQGDANLAALSQAIELAAKNQAQLRVIQVIRSLPFKLSHLQTELQQGLANHVNAVLNKYIEMHDYKVNLTGVDLLIGEPFIEIIHQVIHQQHDMVIKASESKFDGPIVRYFTTDMHLLRKCPSPLWLFKDSHKFKKILATVDTNPEEDNTPARQALNQLILELGSSLAKEQSLDIIHYWRLPGEYLVHDSPWIQIPESVIEEMLKETEQKAKTAFHNLVKPFLADNVKEVLKKGNAGVLIPEYVKENDIDLIVMGTVARTGIPGLIIGNTAEEILRHIQCSILAIKPPGFQTPVS